jgi:cytochrome P450
MSHVAALSVPVPKPAHVPQGVVYDFDMFGDPAYLADPHRRIFDMVETAPPVFWTPRNGGHWIMLSHAANFKASRDVESFSSEAMPQAKVQAMLKMLPPGTPHIPQPFPINLDPPAHTKYRAPLQGAFSPKTITALKDDIRARAAGLVAAVRDRGRCEFMSEIAEPLPVQVFLNMLGLPLDRQAEYRAMVREHLAAAVGNDTAGTVLRLQQIAAVMRPTMLERRETPRNDIFSLLWKTEIAGEPMTIELMENYGVVLFIAGLDTVMNGMGLGVRHLAADLALQDELRANPKLIAEAAEELLRRYTFTVPVRFVAKDLEFEGIPMKEGERVMLFLPGADLTPSEFPQPEQFDLKRENKVHIAFGGGPHRCLGSHLARVELQVLYEELLAGLPRFRLDPEKPPKFHGGHVIGVDTLDLIWDV